MKIAALPQVEFDSFPTNKVSIKNNITKQVSDELTKHLFFCIYRIQKYAFLQNFHIQFPIYLM